MADELVTIIDKPVKLDLDIGDTIVVRVAERDHSKLENLDYEHSGHTGFASQAYADTLSSRITQNEQEIDNNSNKITELGKTVNIVKESIPTKTSEIENDSDYTTKEYVDTQLGATTVKINSLEENKLDKTGGVITGDLIVAGTVTTEKQKTLEVEDNIVYTNANKIALQALLSGLAIYKDSTNLYGILYDPATDSVKLGAGYRDAGGIFHFNANDGSPVAVREDSTKLTDKHIVIWDSATNKLIDSGKTVDEFVDLISEQTIGGLKKFAEQIQANKGIHSDGDIIANNANLKVMDTTKDAVTQYGADKITFDSNNNVVDITLKSLYNATHYIRYKEEITDLAGTTWQFKDTIDTSMITNVPTVEASLNLAGDTTEFKRITLHDNTSLNQVMITAASWDVTVQYVNKIWRKADTTATLPPKVTFNVYNKALYDNAQQWEEFITFLKANATQEV